MAEAIKIKKNRREIYGFERGKNKDEEEKEEEGMKVEKEVNQMEGN